MIPERTWNMDLKERKVEFEVKEILVDEPAREGGCYIKFIDQDGREQEIECNAEDRGKIVDRLVKIEVIVCEVVTNIRLKPKDV